MKIESCELFETRFPMKAAFKTSFGAETNRRILIVKLQGDGITAWGECNGSRCPSLLLRNRGYLSLCP